MQGPPEGDLCSGRLLQVSPSISTGHLQQDIQDQINKDFVKSPVTDCFNCCTQEIGSGASWLGLKGSEGVSIPKA